MSAVDSAARTSGFDARAVGSSARTSGFDDGAVDSAAWAALEDVHDPEIPALSVVDLGVIRSVETKPDAIRVELMPTFVGCPAIEIMRERIRERLAPLASDVHVDVSFAEPWTSDRITPDGRRKLKASGFAPPATSLHAEAAGSLIPLMPSGRCPYCDSRRVVLENAFGPTLCRAIYYCTDCRQPFERFKAV